MTVFRGDLAYHTRRPLFGIWVAIVVFFAWSMSTGSMQIRSGDASVGGTKAWITSEFAVAMQLSVLTPLFYSFFLVTVTGMPVIQDEEWRLGELLHSTPLRPGEYLWAKFAAAMVSTLLVLAIHLAAMIFFNHALPAGEQKEIIGPLALSNYLRPALFLAVPAIVFLGGVAEIVGEMTRRRVLVFLIPLTLLLFDLFFLWTWSPGWLDVRANRALMLLDPGGFRWLQETWLKVDRGAAFYNNTAVTFDTGFLLSRGLFVALGLGAVGLSQLHLARTLRGQSSRWGRLARSASPIRSEARSTGPEPIADRPLSNLTMSSARPGLVSGAWYVARIELSELVFSPGLYLFVPLILIFTLTQALSQVGFLDTPLLVTPGTFAVNTMGPLSTCTCLLLLFYTVESFERERATRLAPIAFATPIRTGSLLVGKAVAQAAVAAMIVLAVALAGMIAQLIQGRVPVRLGPMLLVWGLLLLPTLLLWTTFIMAVSSMTRSRYTTYAVGLAVLGFTGYRLFTGEINWVGNWPLWGAVRWSDISVLEFDRPALVLSRVLALGLGVFFIAFTVRYFRRRETDPIRAFHRLLPRAVMLSALRLSPWAVLPVAAGTWLAIDISRGPEGAAAKKDEKDYWRKNLATYHDSKPVDLGHVELDLELFPASGSYHVRGTYELINHSEKPLGEALLTGGMHWRDLSWTLNGAPFEPVNRSHLYIVTFPRPLREGQTARIGFEHRGRFPRGVSKKGGGASEFILPSGVVLTSLNLSIVPVLGYVDSVGVEEENKAEAREYADDFYLEQTDSFVGSRAPFTTRIKIAGPADFTINSVGIKTADSVSAGRRTVVWESDHPVNFFNVVAGRWQERPGAGTTVYFDPRHPYNVDEIVEALDAARRFYSQWFYPYPWKELKLSEFPALATYAQGFPTNISFSEGVGFLTENSPEIHFAFEITAHEAAHQWWGNILTPGKGPGGNVISEGMAHFSAILLVEQVKGPAARIDFCKRLEANYGRSRRPDAERPLVRTDESHVGDTTVMYDKGAWVVWMLLNSMGRERTLAGLRDFVETYHGNPDHPVLQDFLRVLRKHAEDPAAFDDFARQWFHEVVVPEYQVREARVTRSGNGWTVTALLENVGSGEMPVDVAAVRGQRFDSQGKASPDYREARARRTLGKGEAREVTMDCPFEPERIVVDPDARVLQLRRSNASHSLK
jgi:ABC-type transport system involved in multi-copper enzyme maturation permease subunit